MKTVIKSLMLHATVQIRNQVLTSVDTEKHNVTIEQDPNSDAHRVIRLNENKDKSEEPAIRIFTGNIKHESIVILNDKETNKQSTKSSK